MPQSSQKIWKRHCFSEIFKRRSAVLSFDDGTERPLFRNGKHEKALHFAKEAVALNENNLEFQKKLAFLYIDSGRFEESLSCL